MTWIKRVYLYLVSLVSLVIMIIAAIMLINMALKTWVFPKADNNYYSAPMYVNCTVMDEASKKLEPACTDPDWQKKEEQRVKEDRAAQKQRDAAQALAMIIVAAPVFFYHWKLARKEA